MVSIDIDISLLIQIANFIFLIIALNILLYRPLRDIIRQRREKCEGYETEINRLIGDADNRVQEIESRLSEARRDGFLKKDEIKTQGLETEKEIMTQASRKNEARLEQVKAKISAEIASARETLQLELNIFSRELAQKVLGRSLS
ncbi:MAG: ATP synthase F0 subunit B [Thermodesulfobacteriota bacterium]|nr:ATP synthase F0 subunit B [Thermodesulfobacteriota bacterium]